MKEISGDNARSLALFQKLYYLVFNFFRGIVGHFSILHSRHYSPHNLKISSASPGRHYIDAFLNEFFRTKIDHHRPISVLDIGCGSGYIKELLESSELKGHYLGIDIKKSDDFPRSSPSSFETRFVQTSIEDFESNEQFDLVISNTALEHVKDDRVAVQKSLKMLKPGGIAVHVVPTYPALFLYLFHGYRQYNPRMIKKLFYGINYQSYRLGGFFSFLLHLLYIVPFEQILRYKRLRKLSLYRGLMRIAWKGDRFAPFCTFFKVVVFKKDDQ